jgi:hypothetical protein
MLLLPFLLYKLAATPHPLRHVMTLAHMLSGHVMSEVQATVSILSYVSDAVANCCTAERAVSPHLYHGRPLVAVHQRWSVDPTIQLAAG